MYFSTNFAWKTCCPGLIFNKLSIAFRRFLNFQIYLRNCKSAVWLISFVFTHLNISYFIFLNNIPRTNIKRKKYIMNVVKKNIISKKFSHKASKSFLFLSPIFLVHFEKVYLKVQQ